jgi:hypothetical protein
MFEHHYHSLLFLKLLQDLLEIDNEMDPISKPIKTTIVLKITYFLIIFFCILNISFLFVNKSKIKKSSSIFFQLDGGF